MWSIGIALLLTVLGVSSSDLCDYKSKSCTNHLWTGGPTKMCYMTYYKLNSTECASLNFQYKNDADDIGHVQLKAYVAEDDRRTLFDVLFTNIQWKKALMRFSSIASKTEKNMCRRFNIWENATVSKSSILKYDCPWSYKSYEGQNFIFEYELSWLAVLYKKFIFKVPSFDNFNHLTKLKSLEIFCYVDVTDADYLKLHIQTADTSYNVTHYFVEVIRERNNTITRLTVQVLDAKEVKNGELTYTYSTWNEFGTIYFTVSPINNVCKENECLKSTTPKYLVGHKKSSLVIGMVGASVIIFALFYGLIFWNKKERLLELSPLKIMVVYNLSSNTHCEVVRNLARILQGAFCLTILMDSKDVNHQDPSSWCNQSFTSASRIIYIASPDISSSTTTQETSKDMPNTHDIALRLIKKELRCSRPTKQIIVVTFPYSVNFIPSELSHLKKFNLMKDFDEFSRCIKPPTPFVPTTLLIWSAQHLEMYNDLLNSVYLAESEHETVNSIVGNDRPRITITEQSTFEDDISESDDSNKDEDELLENKLSDLDLSGGADNNAEECKPKSTNINIYTNYFDDFNL